LIMSVWPSVGPRVVGICLVCFLARCNTTSPSSFSHLFCVIVSITIVICGLNFIVTGQGQ